MKTTKFLAAIAVAVIGFMACTTPPCCIDFNNGTSFPTGTSWPMHNDSVYASCGYIVRTDSLFLNGKGYYNYGKVQPPPVAFGTGNVMNTNNITLRIFAVSNPQSSTITFDYLDLGGRENLTINSVLYSGELKTAPASLGGATVSVTSVPAPLPARGSMGTVTITGTIKEFNIGGQEFYLDNICWQ